MADMTNTHTTTTNAVEIPEIWSSLVLESMKARLIMANLVNRRDMDVVNGGDIIHIPVPGAGTVTAYTNGMRASEKLNTATDTEKTITIDKKYFVSWLIQWDTKAQSKYDINAFRAVENGYAIAKQIDNDLSALADSLTTTDIDCTDVTGIEVADILSAFATLNLANVPTTDRAWVFNPKAISQVFRMQGGYFISSEFRDEKPLQSGILGAILGSPVYQTTATDKNGATQNDNNLYFHRDAFALAMQREPQVTSSYENDLFGELNVIKTMYGVGGLHGDYGVCITTA